MRYPILLTAALAFLAAPLRAQLAQPPAGVTEGVVKELTNPCPANPELGNLDASPSWSGWGGAGNARFQTKAASGLTAGRCTQAEAQVELWISRRHEHVFAALGGIRQSLRGE